MRIRFFLFLITILNVGTNSQVYVSNDGDDSNDGSLGSPFKTIQKASDTMGENGICYIRAGVYRETVNVASANQTFENYNDEYVVVTGLDLLSNWSNYKNGIYQAPFSGFETQFTQLFMNGVYQQMARYPDQQTGNMLDVSFASGYDTCVAYNASGSEATRRVHFPKMGSVPDNHWAGGYYRGITGYTWMNPHGKIESSTGQNLTVVPQQGEWINNHIKAKGGGHGFIFHLNALDKPGEWYAQDDKVYFKPPVGSALNSLTIEAQKREWAFNIRNKNGITIKGLHIKAASIYIKASDCTVEDCSVRYLFPYFTRKGYNAVFNQLGGIYINGNSNTFTGCYVAHTWGNGFSLENGNDNVIENCIIDDIGWNAQFTSSILTHGHNSTITHCTLGSTGRFHIRFKNKTNILYCDLYDCMKLGQDAGSIEATSGGAYDTVLDIDGAEIAYNHIHDSNTLPKEGGGKQFVVAFYIEDVANYTVHHNVVWNFKTDVFPDGTFAYLGPRRTTIYDVDYINNTIWNCDYRLRSWNRENKGNIESTRFINNIFDSRMPDSESGGDPLLKKIEFLNNISTDKANMLFVNADADDADFSLKSAAAEAIDKGMVVDGVTDGYEGSAPDIGAYEYGKPIWSAGASIEIPDFIDEVETSINRKSKLKENNILLHPNPLNGGMLQIKNKFKGNTIITIYDVNSRVVFEQKFESSSIIIPINHVLTPGMYLVTAQNNNTLESHKLIIR